LGFFICPATGISWGKYHGRNAVDIANASGGNIIASASGIITKVGKGYNGGLGNYVIIAHSEGVETLYAHLSAIYIFEGQEIQQGAILGLMGATGHCIPAGAVHLHWEVHGADNPLN